MVCAWEMRETKFGRTFLLRKKRVVRLSWRNGGMFCFRGMLGLLGKEKMLFGTSRWLLKKKFKNFTERTCFVRKTATWRPRMKPHVWVGKKRIGKNSHPKKKHFQTGLKTTG